MSGKRQITVTEKISREKTGLNGAIYSHVNFTARGQIDSIRFSHRSKDGGTLDMVLVALGDSLTAIVRGER